MKTKTTIPILDSLIQSLQYNDIDESRYEWLSANDVARELGMHINTIYRIIQKGELKSYNCSVDGRRNYYRIRRVDLQDYLSERCCRW